MKVFAVLMISLFIALPCLSEAQSGLPKSLAASLGVDLKKVQRPNVAGPISITLSAQDMHRLANARMGKPVAVPQLRADNEKASHKPFVRVPVRAFGARTIVIDAGGRRPLLPNKRLFFRSIESGSSAGFSVDTDSGRIYGLLIQDGQSYEIRSAAGLNLTSGGALRLTPLAESEGAGGFTCRNDNLAQPRGLFKPPKRAPGYPSLNATAKATTLSYQATVAVDTDNEWLSDKFANDAVAADTWIDDLFTAMNVIYERDLDLRLLRGDTFLRIDSGPTTDDDSNPATDPRYDADPYSESNDLNEFGNFWLDDPTLGAVSRFTVVMLSGQGISNFSFSGIAWVDAFCVTTRQFPGSAYGSFSFNLVGSGLSAAFTAGGVAHEIGHNLSSQHTHCERLASGGTDFVDHCYSCEDNDGSNCFSSCYVGATSCPASPAVGTLMSYCHAGAAGFDGTGPAQGTAATCSKSDVFNSLIMTKLTSAIASHNPSCIANFVNLGVILRDGFESP